ncbi:tastin isoform X6 [Vicugna pacos]|uniref:Tastin isoform X6 n=1 Tax=Vicugna pacos TaxID=30538 RepID=A0ABM5E725_VICPA
MTTLQATKDPLLRSVSPTPSKIPVRSQRRPPLPTAKLCALDQENQDPRRLVQKLSIQPPLVDSAGTRPKATLQTEQSEKSVGSTQLRNPLEELRPSPGGQNVGPRLPPQTEAPGTIEFVADPAALATILSACPGLCIFGPQNPHPPTGPCQGFLLFKARGTRTSRPDLLSPEARSSDSSFRTFVSPFCSSSFPGAKKRDR